MTRGPTFLVFGGGGWLGRTLVPLLANRGMVVAPSHRKVDLADRAAVHAAVRRAGPDAVVNVAAAQPGCAGDDVLRAVNHLGALHVAEACAAREIRLVHVSTDLVLDGTSPPYADDAPPRPLGAYGRTKAEGESAVLATAPRAVAVRTSLIFDPLEMDRSTAGFASRLAAGQPCRLFVDEVRCPIARGTLAAALAELAGLDVTGTLNVAGAEPVTRHTFGIRLLEWFGVPGLERVEEARAAELPQPRALDLTLDLGLARTILRTPLRSVTAELTAARPERSP